MSGDWKRGGGGRGTTSDRDADVDGPWPGKRPLVVPPARGRSHDLDPGKRTISQTVGIGRAPDVDATMATAEQALSSLEIAIAGRDFGAALGAAATLRRALGDARGAVANTRGESKTSNRSRLFELAGRAGRALEQAPSVSDQAWREFLARGQPRPTWDGEAHAWESNASPGSADANGDEHVLGGPSHSDGDVANGTSGEGGVLNEGHEAGGPLPHRAAMERAFGRSFGDVTAHTGMATELAPLKAKALTVGNTVAFADVEPSPSLVAHEATHVVQNAQAGSSLAMAAGVVAPRESTAEAEADAMAHMVEAHGPGVHLPSVTATPAAHVHLAPYEPLDRTSDAYAMRTAFSARNGEKVLEILARNVDREAMYALRHAYGESFGQDLRGRLTAEQFARARGFAGEQIALDVRIAGEDADGIFRELDRMSDAQALDLVISSAMSLKTAPTETRPVAAWSSLADVQAALRKHVSADEYYRAMRLILEKAQREALYNPDAVTMEIPSTKATPADAQNPKVVAVAMKGALSSLRVDVAEERLRAADGKPGSKTDVDAQLAIADLDADQRKALAMRLKDRPLPAGAPSDVPLTQTDDATVIKQAIVAATKRAALNRQAATGIGIDVALERAGKLIRDARAKAKDTTLSKADRQAAQKEAERLQRMFYDGPDSNSVIAAVEASSNGDADTEKDKLETLGADQVMIGAEMLRGIWVTSNVPGLIEVLKKIPAEHRRAAMDRASKLDDVRLLPEERRHLVEAYLDVGAAPPPNTPVIVINSPDLDTVAPEITIALADVVEGIAHGPSAAHLVLSRLQRLAYPSRKILFAQAKYRAAVANMPQGEPGSDERDFVDAIARAEVSDIGPDIAIEKYPGPGGPWQQVALEHVRVVADRVGQATLRRGWVLHERVKDNDVARAALEPDDRIALQHYEELNSLKPLFFDPKQGDTADDIAFGSIQLTDSPTGAVDPNTEATFMDLRLHKAVGLAPAVPLSSWAGSPAAIEALTEFQAMYTNERPGGVTRGVLAQLAEIYYRALREVEKYKTKLAENEGLASLAATVAGVVVAVGISILSAGTAIPMVAAAALGGMAAGVASAAAGSAVRIHSTSGTVLRDFGSGFVDGVTSIASAGLAAKIVRGASAGVGAGKAAASIGSHVVAEATGHTGAAAIAEAAIDGAFSGAAGELFQTAVDEATWDRGVGEAIAKMLAAIARGAAMGAAAGGLMGGLAKLAKRLGPQTAESVGKLLDRASIGREVVDGFSEHVQDELARAAKLIENDQLADAEKVIQGLTGITSQQRDLLLAAARARAVFRTAATEGVELEGEFRFPEFVDDAKFRELAGNQDAHAMVVVRDGKPGIIARKGTPISSIREEVIHLHQWESNLAMRGRMQNLSEEKLAKWHDLGPPQKLAMHIDRLEIEADAQRQIVHHLAGSEDDPEAALRLLDAEEALFLTNERLTLLKAARPPLDVTALEIDKVPRIFSSTAQSAKASGPGSRSATKLVGEKVEDSAVQKKLKDLGYSVHRIEGEGNIFRITRNPDKTNLPHLSIENGKIIPGKPRQNFAEIKADAAAEWGTKQKDLTDLSSKLDRGKLDDAAAKQAHLELAQSGYRTVRVELRHMVEKGKIDAGTAGLVANWGRVLEDLESRFGVDIKKLLAKHLVSKSISDAELSALRGEIREITVAEIMKLRGARRADVLHEVLVIQPDNASKGHLFREYRREAMRVDKVGSNPTYGVSDGVSPESFHGDDLHNRRTPDDVVHIQEQAKGQLGQGRYAVEDKAGEGAFKIDQAEDYARRSYKAGKPGGGFTQVKGDTKTVYDGLIYVFSTEDEARRAFDLMSNNSLVNKVLGKEPGGIHVMYVDAFGKVVRL